MQVCQIHNVVPPAFELFHTHQKVPKCRALATECVSANSKREEAAEQVLDAHCTVGWISKIMSVHISYPCFNLSPPGLAKGVALQIPLLPFIFMTGGAVMV